MARSFEIPKPTYSHSSDQPPTRSQLLILLKQFHQEDISEILGSFYSNHYTRSSLTIETFNQVEISWRNYILSGPLYWVYSFHNFCIILVVSMWSNTYHLSIVKCFLCLILHDLLIYWNSHGTESPEPNIRIYL